LIQKLSAADLAPASSPVTGLMQIKARARPCLTDGPGHTVGYARPGHGSSFSSRGVADKSCLTKQRWPAHPAQEENHRRPTPSLLQTRNPVPNLQVARIRHPGSVAPLAGDFAVSRATTAPKTLSSAVLQNGKAGSLCKFINSHVDTTALVKSVTEIDR
jgi:hypothetical protein